MPAPKDPEKRKRWKQNISKNTKIAMSRPDIQKKISGKNHHMYGEKQSIESNEKNRQSQVLRYAQNPVKQTTKEMHRQAALKQFKDGMPQETKEKIRKTLTGTLRKPHLVEAIEKMRKAATGRIIDTETREKIRMGNIGKQSGNKNGRWLGGKSFEPYSTEWTNKLKQAIRKRDNYTCQECNNYGNIVHHIDYNKENCNPDNLITLCRKCHSITNGYRQYWTKYFQNKLTILTNNLQNNV